MTRLIKTSWKSRPKVSRPAKRRQPLNRKAAAMVPRPTALNPGHTPTHIGGDPKSTRSGPGLGPTPDPFQPGQGEEKQTQITHTPSGQQPEQGHGRQHQGGQKAHGPAAMIRDGQTPQLDHFQSGQQTEPPADKLGRLGPAKGLDQAVEENHILGPGGVSVGQKMDLPLAKVIPSENEEGVYPLAPGRRSQGLEQTDRLMTDQTDYKYLFPERKTGPGQTPGTIGDQVDQADQAGRNHQTGNGSGPEQPDQAQQSGQGGQTGQAQGLSPQKPVQPVFDEVGPDQKALGRPAQTLGGQNKPNEQTEFRPGHYQPNQRRSNSPGPPQPSFSVTP